MAKRFKGCCASFKNFSKADPLSHVACRRDRAGGLVSGRKLNVVLGKDPDDTKGMDPNTQHYVCSYMQSYCAKHILPNDPRLRKAKPPKGVPASRRSRRVELLNPDRETLDAGSLKKMKEIRIFCGGRYIFAEDEEDEEDGGE